MRPYNRPEHYQNPTYFRDQVAHEAVAEVAHADLVVELDVVGPYLAVVYDLGLALGSVAAVGLRSSFCYRVRELFAGVIEFFLLSIRKKKI